MEIKVIKESPSRLSTALTGGEYATSLVKIYVDRNLPAREQRSRVVHAVIENYFPSIPHEKVDELEDLIIDALEQLEGR